MNSRLLAQRSVHCSVEEIYIRRIAASCASAKSPFNGIVDRFVYPIASSLLVSGSENDHRLKPTRVRVGTFENFVVLSCVKLC